MSSTGKSICLSCLKMTCNCSDERIYLGKKLRPPKHNASKNKWKQFVERFFHRNLDKKDIRLRKKFNLPTIEAEMDSERKQQEDAKLIELEKSRSVQYDDPCTMRCGEIVVNNIPEDYMEFLVAHNKVIANRKYYVFEYFSVGGRYINTSFINSLKIRHKIIFNSHQGYYTKEHDIETNTNIKQSINGLFIFNEKWHAELFQELYFRKLHLFPYKESIVKELKKNKVQDTHPEYFI